MVQYIHGSHSTLYLKYHLIWCTKYRYKILTGDVAIRTRELIRQIALRNEVSIEKGHVSTDHIHLLVSTPPTLSISHLIQYFKGASSLKLFQEFPHLKKKYWGQHLWARGYFASTVGNVNEKQIKDYIEHQDEPDTTNFTITDPSDRKKRAFSS